MKTSAAPRFPIEGGAYVSLDELIRLRHLGADFETLQRQQNHNPLAGMIASRVRGRGMDFSEVRQYEPGDDVRTIDWRVTARTGKAHTKLFQEEKERPVMILTDQSHGMFFGSVFAFKSVIAAQAAALIAWSALSQGDRVGGIVFDDVHHHQFRPRRNKRTVLQMLNAIAEYNQKLKRATPSESYFMQAIRNAREAAKHGTTIFIISDFRSLPLSGLYHLEHLCAHHDVMAIHVSDPLETELPPPERYTITNGLTRLQISTDNRNRQTFSNAYKEHFARVKATFMRLGAEFLCLSSSEPILDSFDRQTRA